MTKRFGVNDRIQINLETDNMRVEQPSEELFYQFIGGKSLGVHYIRHYSKPGIELSSSKNKLVFSTGLLTKIPVSVLSSRDFYQRL